MRLYWSLRSIPELSGLQPSERRRVWRAACWRSYNHWQTWVSVFGIGLFVLIGSILGAWMGQRSIGEVIGAAVGGFVISQVFTEFARPYLRAFLLSGQVEPAISAQHGAQKLERDRDRRDN